MLSKDKQLDQSLIADKWQSQDSTPNPSEPKSML